MNTTMSALEDDYLNERHPELQGMSKDEMWAEIDSVSVDGHKSKQEHLRSLRLSIDDYPEAFPWQYYTRLNPSAGAHKWAALDDFVRRGFANTPLLPYHGDAKPFLIALARSYAGGNDRLAIVAFQLAARTGSLAADESQHLADSYLREGLWEPARRLYKQIIDDGAPANWTVKNYVKASLDCGCVDEAVEALIATRSDFQSDEVWRSAARDVIRHVFEDGLQRARSRYAEGQRAEGSAAAVFGIDRAHALLEDLLPCPATAIAPSNTILLVANRNNEMSCRTIVDQRLALLKSAGFRMVTVDMNDISAVHERLPSAFAVVFFNVPVSVDMLEIAIIARARGAVLFYEADEALFDEACQPGPIERYGGRISPALFEELTLDVVRYRELARICDRGLARTQAIARRLGAVLDGRPVEVMPSPMPARHESFESEGELLPLVHERQYLPPSFVFIRSPRFVRLEDAGIGAVLMKFLKSRADVWLVTSGYVWLSAAFNSIDSRIIELGASNDPASYAHALASADVNLILYDGPADDGLADTNWLEASGYGVASLMSLECRAALDLHDGVCLTAIDDDWEYALHRAFDSSLSEIGQAACDAACASRSFELLASRLREIFTIERA